MFFLHSSLLFNFTVLLLESITFGKNTHPFTLINKLDYKEYKFYLFFLSFYIICFTALLLLEFWYNKPENKLSNKKIRKFALYERKGFLNMFSLWLFRFTILVFIFNNSSILYCIPLYKEYFYLFVLLAIVLYFDLWIGLKRVFKIHWAYPIALSLVFVLFSFVLTNVRPYNDKEKLAFINKGYHFKNINLPELELIHNTSNFNNYHNIYFTKNKKVLLNKKEISLDKIRNSLSGEDKEIISFFFNTFGVNYVRRNGLNAYIDAKIKMKDIKAFFKILIKAGIENVFIFSTKTNYDCDNNESFIPINLYNFDYSFYTLRTDSKIPPTPPPPLYVENESKNFISMDKKNIIQVKITDNNLTFNGKSIKLKDLKELLIKENNKLKIITLKYGDNISFQKYIETYNAIRNSIYSQRDEMSYELTGFSYLGLYNESQWGNSQNERKKFKEYYKLIKEEHPFKLVQKELKKDNQ